MRWSPRLPARPNQYPPGAAVALDLLAGRADLCRYVNDAHDERSAVFQRGRSSRLGRRLGDVSRRGPEHESGVRRLYDLEMPDSSLSEQPMSTRGESPSWLPMTASTFKERMSALCHGPTSCRRGYYGLGLPLRHQLVLRHTDSRRRRALDAPNGWASGCRIRGPRNQ